MVRAGWDQKNLYLLDASESALDFAQKTYSSAHIFLEDAEEGIGFDNCFDCILMVEVLEHMLNPRKVMENAMGAPKTSGLVIIRGLPNNRSLEAFIGQAEWMMRASEHHYQFFSPETFSVFAESFLDAEIVESGCFLQEGYRVYDILSIAGHIAIMGGQEGHGRIPQTDKLTELILDKLKSTDFDDYVHKERYTPAATSDSLKSGPLGQSIMKMEILLKTYGTATEERRLWTGYTGLNAAGIARTP